MALVAYLQFFRDGNRRLLIMALQFAICDHERQVFAVGNGLINRLGVGDRNHSRCRIDSELIRPAARPGRSSSPS
jgi:hypothetical protein